MTSLAQTPALSDLDRILAVLASAKADEHVEEDKREDFLNSLAKEVETIYKTNLPENGVNNDQRSRKLMETVDLLFTFDVGSAVDAQARSGYRKYIAIKLQQLEIS